MSKDAALSMLTGTVVTDSKPSLITGEIPKGETDPNAVKEPVKPPEPSIDSDRFARIAAKEAKLVQEREAFKAEQLAIQKEKEALKSVQGKINEFEELRKTDPVAALKTLGFTETDILNFMADKQPEELTPEQKASAAAQEEIKKFREEQAKIASDEQKKRDDAALARYKENIGQVIAKEAEKYEFCAHYGPAAEQLIYDTILECTKEDMEAGEAVVPHKIMQEAIELVEGYYEKEAQALDSLKKRQPKPVETKEVLQPQRTRHVETKPNTPQRPIPTLSNRATATAASSATRKESPSEKRERLESILRNGITK